jgi:cell division protein FtsX
MRITKPKTTATDPEEVQAMAQDLIEDVETVKDHTEVVMKIAQTTI